MLKADAKTVGLLVSFTALTIVLNLSPLKVPAPYAPYLIYQVWEVPIVAAFLLYGFNLSLLIAILNMLVLLAVFPGMLITGPLYNLLAVISMLSGMAILKCSRRNPWKNGRAAIAVYTFLGVSLRVSVMTAINWIILRFPPPVGFAMPDEAVLASLPFIAFFNATLAAYTIPLGFIIARTVKTQLRHGG